MFIEKWNLMNYRKIKHPNTVAFCRNKIAGKCNFSSQMCWWNHEEIENSQVEDIKCYLCKETFESKAKMMYHRKTNHQSVVRKCNKFLQNNCKFQMNLVGIYIMKNQWIRMKKGRRKQKWKVKTRKNLNRFFTKFFKTENPR